MRHTVKIASLAVTVIVLTAVLSCVNIYNVYAEDGSWTDPSSGITYGYTTQDNVLTLTSCSNIPSNGIVNIPDSIGGKSVKSIARNCFDGCSGIRIIKMPKSIEEMELRNACLRKISTLEAIQVDADNPAYMSVDGVLYNKDGTYLILYPPAKAGTNYNVRTGVTMICEGAFENTSLQSVSLPDSLVTIGVDAFYNSALKSVNIPEGVKNIEGSAFSHCTALNKIELHEGLKFIGEQGFYGAGITAVELPKSLETLCSGAFINCKELRSVVISEGITEINTELFSGCSKLENVVLPSDLSRIEGYAFCDTTALRALYISTSVVYIDIDAFAMYHLGIRVNNDTLTLYSASGSYIEQYASTNSFKFSAMTYSEYSILRSEGKLPDGTVPTIPDGQGSSGSGDSGGSSGGGSSGGGGSGDGSGSSGGGSGGGSSGGGSSGGGSGSGGGSSGSGSGSSGGGSGSGGGSQTEPADPDDQKGNEDPKPDEGQSSDLKEQSIICPKSFKKTTNSKKFDLNAEANTELAFKSTNERVARVSSKGIVTISGPGTARIIIKAAQTDNYLAAEKSVAIKVKLAAPKLKVRTSKKHLARIQWTKSRSADGYKVYVRAPGEKKYRCRLTKNSKVKGVIHRGLIRGKKYSYKIKAFKRIGGKTIYSDYSPARTIKAK